MIDAATLQRLMAIDMPPEALKAVLQVFADVQYAEEERRKNDRDRKRAGRVRGNSTETPGIFRSMSDGNSTECPADTGFSSAPQRDIIKPPSTSSDRSQSRDALRSAFDAFWSEYPHKVGKPVAERAFAKVYRDLRGDIGELLTGLRSYMAGKPDFQSWLNPSTFLNQRRWQDQPARAPAAQPRAGPPASSDGLAAARQALRDRVNGRDQHETERETSGVAESRDRTSDRCGEEQDRDRRYDREGRAPMLDLVAERAH